MLLLDTSRHPARDRAEIVRGSLGELAGSTVETPRGDAPIRVRLRAWDMGDGCSLFHSRGSDLRVRRLSSHISSSETRNISFSVQSTGRARFSQNSRDEVVPRGGMFLAEMTEVYTYQFAGPGENATFQIPLEIRPAAIHVLRALVKSFGTD